MKVKDDSVRETISQLSEKVERLEGEVSKLKEQHDDKPPKPTEKDIMQDLYEQNDRARKEIQELFGFDDETESESIEGLLSEFADENENSLELVRSVRHPS